MFGDDPNPTVTTARVGSGEVSDAHERSMHGAKRGRLAWENIWCYRDSGATVIRGPGPSYFQIRRLLVTL